MDSLSWQSVFFLKILDNPLISTIKPGLEQTGRNFLNEVICEKVSYGLSNDFEKFSILTPLRGYTTDVISK